MMALPVITRYALATCVPLLLLFLATAGWGAAAYLALIWLTLIAAGLDGILAPPAAAPAGRAPWSEWLSIGLALGHLALLPAVILAVTGPALSGGEKGALFLATASFFGQVSHPNAHELIHRKPRALAALGAAVYAVLGFGHHVSAHRLVHHRCVGTPDDPNTPLPGESFWRYLPRAWAGSFRAGLACEEDRLRRRNHALWGPRNPFLYWVGGGVLTLGLAAWLGGVGGVLILLGLGALMGGQILLSDYIQHYGLQRLVGENGRLEPVAAHHSWNAPKGFSSYLMMAAPAHSEHHLHPDRPYDRLDPAAAGPTLPYSLPIMALLATVPQVWHRMMDRRALKVMEAAQARLSEVEGEATSHRGQGAAKPIRSAAMRASDTDALIRRVTQSAQDA